MNTIQFTGSKAKLMLPSCWEELHAKQYITLTHLICQLYDGELTVEEVKLFFVCRTLNIIKSKIPQNFETRLAIDFNLMQLTNLMDWIFRIEKHDQQETIVLNLGYAANLLPYFWHGYTKYHGPKEAMQDLQYIEFIQAHSHYIRFTHTQETDALDMLVATLYQPRHRRRYAEDTEIELRARKIAHLQFHVKYAVYLWFESVMQWLIAHTMYGIIFQRQSENRDPDPLGLLSVAYSYAERQIFGTFDTTLHTNLYNVLDVMAADKRADIEMKKLMKK